MTALGQERTSPAYLAMSALPLKADKAQTCWHVRLGPKGDIRIAADFLFNHLIGALLQFNSSIWPLEGPI